MLQALRRGVALASLLLPLGMAEAAWGLQEEPIPFVVDADTPLRVEPNEAAEPLRMLEKDELVDIVPSAPISAGFVQVTTQADHLDGWTSTTHLRLSLPDEILEPAIGLERDVQTLDHLGVHQAPNQPTVQAFSDGINWMLREPLVYTIGMTANSIEVPIGFVTDFATGPRYLRRAIRSTGTFSAAAVVHDFLYWTQVCTRSQADRLFQLAMEESGVPYPLRNGFYLVVRFAGDGAWNDNKANRQDGMIRVVPEPHNIVPPRARWDSYRDNLAALGIGEAQYSLPTPATCAFGN